MTIAVTYMHARANLAQLLSQVIDDREVVVIQRSGHEDVAMIPAAELTSLMETAYLLRSPKNAERFLSALNMALKDEGASLTVAELRRGVNLG